MHFYAWKSGLKTGMYYLRTKAATQAIQFTVDKSKIENKIPKSQEEYQSMLKEAKVAAENGEDCEMCSG